MNIHERIKQRRIDLNLSVDDVALKLGVSRATVYRYESAEIKNMGIDKISPLAEALNTTPVYLMGWTDDPDLSVFHKKKSEDIKQEKVGIKIFGNRLENLRKKVDLSQVELEEILGVTKQTVASWENNNSEPSFDIVLKISEYFNVSTDYLLGRTDKFNFNLRVSPFAFGTVDEEPSAETLKIVQKLNLAYLTKYIYMFKRLSFCSQERVLLTIIYEYEKTVLGIPGEQLLKKLRIKETAV